MLQIFHGSPKSLQVNTETFSSKRPVHLILPSAVSLFISIYGSTALVDLGRFFSFLIRTQSVDRGSERRKTAQTQNKRTQYRHPCLEWDSNPRPQRSNERRQFMP
jgi:hypothetical protein